MPHHYHLLIEIQIDLLELIDVQEKRIDQHSKWLKIITLALIKDDMLTLPEETLKQMENDLNETYK